LWRGETRLLNAPDDFRYSFCGQRKTRAGHKQVRFSFNVDVAFREPETFPIFPSLDDLDLTETRRQCLNDDVGPAADHFLECRLNGFLIHVREQIPAARNLNQIVLKCTGADAVKRSNEAGAAVVDDHDFRRNCRPAGVDFIKRPTDVLHDLL